MILIVSVAIIYSTSLFLNLPAKLSLLTPHFHHFCLRLLPTTVENYGSLEALVCGKNMHELELKQLLIQSSLIHIFIVSGSHFNFLHKILAKLPWGRICGLPILFAYCLMTLCQPPAVRALISLLLGKLSARKWLQQTSILQVFLSCVFTVCIFPQWISSRSLLMSLLAALTIAASEDFLSKKSKTLMGLFLTQVAVYFIMGFCLWGFSNLHPLGILFNLMLGPLIGGVVFPLAILVVFIPQSAFLFDGSINILTWILWKASETLGSIESVNTPKIYWHWILFFILVISLYFISVAKNRQRARHAKG